MIWVNLKIYGQLRKKTHQKDFNRIKINMLKKKVLRLNLLFYQKAELVITLVVKIILNYYKKLH